MHYVALTVTSSGCLKLSQSMRVTPMLHSPMYYTAYFKHGHRSIFLVRAEEVIHGEFSEWSRLFWTVSEFGLMRYTSVVNGK